MDRVKPRLETGRVNEDNTVQQNEGQKDRLGKKQKLGGEALTCTNRNPRKHERGNSRAALFEERIGKKNKRRVF